MSWGMKSRWRIYVSMNWVIVDSDSVLLPIQCQAFTWGSDDLLSVAPLETKASEIQIKIRKLSFKKMHLNMFAKSWPFLFWTSFGH